MSEEQQDHNNTPPETPPNPVPRRRLIAGTPPASSSRRLVAGSGEGLGNLKISMTPEQEAAIARAKAIREAAELEAAKYAEEQAKYEADLKAYEEFQAAEKIRLEEEARQAEEAKAAEEAQKAEEAAAKAEEALNAVEATPPESPAPSSTVATPDTAAPADAVDANDPAALAALAAKQLEAAQALMAQAQALQASATGQMPPSAAPAAESPAPAPAPTLRRSIATGPIPAPTVPPVATPAIQPTSSLPGTRSYMPGTRPVPAEDFTVVPLWKKPAFFIPIILAILVMGGAIVWYYPQYKMAHEVKERFETFAKWGADDSKDIIPATPADLKFAIEQVRKDPGGAWQAGASAINKMMKADPSYGLTVMDDLIKNYKDYQLKGVGNLKARQLYYYVMVQKTLPDGLKTKMLDFYDVVPDDYKPEVLYVGYRLMEPSDLNFLIGIINDPATQDNERLRFNAERTAVKVMEITPDKDALTNTIMNNYNLADDKQKNVYLRLMGKTGSAQGLQFLKNILDNKDSGIVAYRNVLKALGAWPNDDAIAVLMEFKDKPQAKGEAEPYVSAELYRSLSTPGRKRDMAKVQPLIDYLKSLTRQDEKLRLIAALKGNAQSDQWAIDLLTAFYDDKDDKVSFEAERALEKVRDRKPPVQKDTAKEEDDDLKDLKAS